MNAKGQRHFAVIGLSGRFPMNTARSLAGSFHHLAAFLIQDALVVSLT